MLEERFKVWLEVERGLSERTVGSRISNCNRVEHYEGDLDAHCDADGLTNLMERLNPREPAHKIPINGNIYNGTATLKSAVGLYCDFRNADTGTAGSTRAPVTRRPRVRRSQRPGAGWPVWTQPNDKDILELARAIAPFVRFLDPDIVNEVVEDNRRMEVDWSVRLEAFGIDPAIYLWEGSPCAFPGVRRYAGSTENAVLRKRAAERKALRLYGDICRIVPPPLAVKPCEDQNWALDNFRWSKPVGGMDFVPEFLEFRRKRMGELIERYAAPRTDGTR